MNINETINKLFLLADVMEQYTLEIEKHVKNEFKQDLRAISTRCRKLVKFADKNLCEDSQEAFGNSGDELRHLIDKHFEDDKI